jgi:hypothetical protein
MVDKPRSNFFSQILRDVSLEEGEAGAPAEMLCIFAAPRAQIVHADDAEPAVKEGGTQVVADEPRSACYDRIRLDQLLSIP